MTTAIVVIVELVRHCWRHFCKIYYSLRSLSYEFMLVDDRTHFVLWIPFLNKIMFKPNEIDGESVTCNSVFCCCCFLFLSVFVFIKLHVRICSLHTTHNTTLVIISNTHSTSNDLNWSWWSIVDCRSVLVCWVGWLFSSLGYTNSVSYTHLRAHET